MPRRVGPRCYTSRSIFCPRGWCSASLRAIPATLPEGFFLQVFLSVQSLLISFLGYWSSDVELGLWLIYIYMYITYRQLFGYGWWSTLWRLVVVMLSHLVVIATIAAVVLVLFIYRDEESNAIFLLIIAAMVLLTAVMLLVTHRINKRAVNQER